MHARPLVGSLVAAVLLVGCGPSVPTIQLEAQPSVSPSASPSPTTSPTPPETTTSETPSPTPTETTPRPATDTARARFVAAYQPDGASHMQHVATDLDGDGTEELLFAYVRGGQVAHVDVAWWTGTEYEVRFAADGGTATRIGGLRADDLNDDGLVEVVTMQAGPDARSSLSVWRVGGNQQVAGLPAAGGCADGSNTYGVTGAELDDRDADGAEEIYATCADGSVDRYAWEAGAYRHAPELVP